MLSVSTPYVTDILKLAAVRRVDEVLQNIERGAEFLREQNNRKHIPCTLAEYSGWLEYAILFDFFTKRFKEVQKNSRRVIVQKGQTHGPTIPGVLIVWGHGNNLSDWLVFNSVGLEYKMLY